MTGERTDPGQRALSLAQHMGNASEALSALLVEVIRLERWFGSAEDRGALSYALLNIELLEIER